MADFPYIEWLTRRYLERAKQTGDWRTYLQAHGLANYCVVVDAREERWRLVYHIEKCWYKVHPLTFPQHQQLTNKHRRLLEEYRNDMRQKFGDLKTTAKLLDGEKLFDKQNLESIENFTSEVTKASQACSEGLANISKDIISSSVDVLKQAGSEAPCGFAVLGLGSIAKGEATPYSDLEYAFLVEHDDEYFTSLAMDSYFRLGNLGESPLKTFDIVELKHKDERLPLVTENLIKAGLRIDGITKNSGNIPTGNGKENSQSLSLTVDGLMELYKSSAESPFDGMAGDKSDMLSSTVVVYANERTTLQLHADFEQERQKYEENEVRAHKIIGEKRFESFKQDLSTYTFLPEFVEFKPPANLDVKVKADIFRYPTLLANNVKMCLGLNTRYSWDVFDWLMSEEMLSTENHLFIQTVLALSIYMRTSAYLHHGCQTDTMTINPDISQHTSQFYAVDLNLFIILGRILIPLKQHIASVIDATAVSESLAVQMAATLIDESARCLSSGHEKQEDSHTIIGKFLATFQIDHEDYFTMSEIFYFAGRYSLAKMWICQAFGGSLELNHAKIMFAKQHTNKQAREKYIELCGYVLYYTGAYFTAMDYMLHFINHKEAHSRLWKLLLAVCKHKTGDYQSARHLLDEVKVMKEEDVMSADFEANHPDTSDGCNNIGNAYSALGEYTLALEYYTKSLEMKKAVYGVDAMHPDIATSFNNIGNVCIDLGEYTSALDYHTKSLEMRKSLYGVEANHPNVAHCYNGIGIVYSSLGDHPSALEYHTKSLAVNRVVYGANANHPDVALNYNNIGNAHGDLGDHASALEYHIKALKMQKAVNDDGTNHLDIAASCNNIGIACKNLGEYTSAMEYHTKSLEIMRNVYGAEANHRDIADCCNNVGNAFRGLGEHTSALKHYTKSLEMRKAVYGADANHHEIASSYHNIGSAYSDLGEYALALEYHTKSLEMMNAVYGTDANHPHIAGSYNNIGFAYYCLGEYTSALEYFLKSLEMRKAVYGDTSHPDIAVSYDNIGCACESLGECTSALEYHTKSLDMKKSVYGVDVNHPDIAASYNNIGNACSGLSDYTSALEYHTKSLHMQKSVYGDDTNHLSIAVSYNNIGDAYRDLGEYASAVECHTKSLDMRKAVYGAEANHPDIANSYQAIGHLYYDLNENELSWSYLTKSLDMYLTLYGHSHPRVNKIIELLHSLAD